MIPVVGKSEVILAMCTAAKAQPAADVSWSLGALSDSVKVQTNVSTDPDGSYTVTSYLISVASKDLNQQKVQCLVNHTSLNEVLRLDYTLIIHYPPQVVYIISVNVPTASQEFQCVVDANPQPANFTWSRVNKTLSSHVDADRLIIPLTSDNNGVYICNVSNQYGNGAGTLYVQVSRESTTVCWGLFTFLLLGFIAACLMGWKFNLMERLRTFMSGLRNRISH
ncbi:nectin-3-like isoform X2 [Colossoma macropomum]|uniref:nectin-3-like isoform X2 n=1 Tax=Colossoma macropomum TaxID=42526 RepID=UPI001864D1BA|nr:nectin-3-like isoform X2 [Colossoma macropomum]